MTTEDSRADLYHYYLRELAYLKEEGTRFAQMHPSEAKYLNIDETEIIDPHVERLVETFCFMTARVQRNIDIEYPSLIAYLANFMYPNLFSPIPSATIVSMDCDLTQSVEVTGSLIPKNTEIETYKGETADFGFRTVYPVTIWPINVNAIEKEIANTVEGFENYGNHWMLSIHLFSESHAFSLMEISKLRFFINVEEITASILYERLFTDVAQVIFKSGGEVIACYDAQAIQRVGFDQGQDLINVPENSESARNVLFDYCYFKQKFLFFDCVFPECRKVNHELSVHFIFKSSKEFPEVNRSTFLLNCTPVVNISSYYSIPFSLNDASRTYRVMPDSSSKEQLDVHSIEKVFFSESDSKTVEIPSIFDFKLHEDDSPLTWTYERSALADKEGKSLGLYLSFLTKEHRYHVDSNATVYASLNCISRDYYQLIEHSKFLRFKEAHPVKNLRMVSSLSKSYGPLIDSQLIWCLYSCMRFDQVSLCDQDSAAAIKDVLRAVNRYSDNVVEHNIASLKNIKLAESASFVKVGYYPTIVRGYDIELEINSEEYSGGSPFLFSSVIESYLANLVAINSFTRVSLKYSNNNITIKQWPARIGQTSLI